MNPTTIAPSRGRQRGQSSTEYTVVCALLAGLFFAASSPLGQQLAQSIHNFYKTLSFYMSLP